MPVKTDRIVNILLVGDIASRRALIRAMLESADAAFRVGTAETIGEAAANLQDGGIDLVILDSREGTAIDLGSIPVLRCIAPSLPILAVLPMLDEMDSRIADNHGASGCLVLENYDEKGIAALLRRYLARPAQNDATRIPHVLIVEDEPSTAEILTRYVSWRGYRVSVVHNGREALDLMMSDPADLVITDLDMPVLDGEGLIAELQACERRPHIIVVTGTPVSDLTWKKLRNAVVELYQKPLNLKEIGRTVERLIGISLRPVLTVPTIEAR